jgi:hypothetical protein
MKISKLIKKNYEESLDLARKMKPKERLLAFYQHSRLLTQIAESGKEHRRKNR